MNIDLISELYIWFNYPDRSNTDSGLLQGLKDDLYLILEQERLCMLDYSRWKSTSRLAATNQKNIGVLLGRPDITFENIADIIRKSQVA